MDWPGVSSARALHNGETTLHDTWYDRTAQYEARRRGEKKLFPSRETVTLSPLPFLGNLTPAQQQRFMFDAVRRVEQDAREKREKEGATLLGVERILRQHLHKPAKFQRSPAPLFLTATREEHRAMRTARALTVQAYRDAAERMKRGERDVSFPVGTFPPPQPFVTTAHRTRAEVGRAPPPLRPP